MESARRSASCRGSRNSSAQPRRQPETLRSRRSSGSAYYAASNSSGTRKGAVVDIRAMPGAPKTSIAEKAKDTGRNCKVSLHCARRGARGRARLRRPRLIRMGRSWLSARS